MILNLNAREVLFIDLNPRKSCCIIVVLIFKDKRKIIKFRVGFIVNSGKTLLIKIKKKKEKSEKHVKEWRVGTSTAGRQKSGTWSPKGLHLPQ